MNSNKNSDEFWSRVAIGYDPDTLYQDALNFKSAKEADRYFTEICGPGWSEQPWAKFYLKHHDANERRTVNRRNKFQSLDDEAVGGRLLNMFVARKNNYEYFVMKAVRRGITNHEIIIQELRARGYRPTVEHVQWYINKYRRIFRSVNPPRELLIEFIKFYRAKGLSSRKIEQELSKNDSVFISYRQIQNLAPELFKETSDELL